MTRKDYIRIAQALRATLTIHIGLTSEQQQGVLRAAESIADALRADNSRFDRDHFLAVVRGEREPNSRPQRRT